MLTATTQMASTGGCLRTPASLFSGAYLSIQVMSAVWKNAPLEGRRLLVLLALADNSNDDGMSYPSVRYIAEKTRQSERNVQYSLRHIEKLGLLRRAEDESGFIRYFINLAMIGGASFAPIKQDEITSPCTGGVQPSVKTIPALAPKPSLTVNEPSEVKISLLELESQSIYELYPRKAKKPKAIAAIKKAVARETQRLGCMESAVVYLKVQTEKYYRCPYVLKKFENGEERFIPHPASWFNAEAYNDEDDWGLSINESNSDYVSQEKALADYWHKKINT